MKKILLIGLLLIGSLALMAQKHTDIIVSSTTLVADTINMGMSSYSGAWGIHIATASLDATDSQFKIQVSYSAAGTWMNYSSNSTITMGATDTNGYSDSYLVWPLMRIIVIPNSVTSGTYAIRLLTIVD